MPFDRGHKKTGGRKLGVPNKDRRDIIESLHDLYPGYHPVLALAEIANNKKNDITLRFQAHKEIAKYICPQLKAVEINSISKPENNEEKDTIDYSKLSLSALREIRDAVISKRNPSVKTDVGFEKHNVKE